MPRLLNILWFPLGWLPGDRQAWLFGNARNVCHLGRHASLSPVRYSSTPQAVPIPRILSSNCRSFGDRVPVDFIYWCPISKWSTVTWSHVPVIISYDTNYCWGNIQFGAHLIFKSIECRSIWPVCNIRALKLTIHSFFLSHVIFSSLYWAKRKNIKLSVKHQYFQCQQTHFQCLLWSVSLTVCVHNKYTRLLPPKGS